MVRRASGSNLIVNENGRLIDPDKELQYSNFLGIHLSKASADRAAKRKADRRGFALEKIKTRNEAKINLSQQGIAAPSGAAQALQPIASIVGSVISGFTGLTGGLLGGKSTTSAESAVDAQTNQSLGVAGQRAQLAAQQNGMVDKSIYTNNVDSPFNAKNLPYVIGGVLIFVIVIIFLLNRK